MEVLLSKVAMSMYSARRGRQYHQQHCFSYCPMIRKTAFLAMHSRNFFGHCQIHFKGKGKIFPIIRKSLGKIFGDQLTRTPYRGSHWRSYRPLFCSSKMSDNTKLEDKAFLETPDFPEALQYMYWTYVASCLIERAWRFALPALVALLSDSLSPVALNSFVSQLFVFVGGPLVGTLMDSVPRVYAFTLLSFMQTVSILVSAAMVMYATSTGRVLGSSLVLVKQPWFLVLICASAVDRITGLATGVAFERDWVVLLAGRRRTVALAKANAMLRRVDLICEIVGPFLFGLALSKYSSAKCVLSSCAIAIVSLPLLILLVQRTYNLSSGVLDRPNAIMEEHKLSVSLGLEVFTQGWILYLMQPILPASIAYVLLSFNAVLAPSGLMTTFLTRRGLNPAVIGSYRGLCALMGFLATYLASVLIEKFGTIKAGAISLTYQAFLLCLAVLLYLLGPVEKQTTLFLFLLLVILSRLGHWAYDVVIGQIFQTAVPMSNANAVSAAEMSLASFAELVMLAVAIVANDISHFGALAGLSMTAVCVAACLYWAWLANGATNALFKQEYL